MMHNDSNLTVSVWQDNRPVVVIASNSGPAVSTSVTRKNKDEIVRNLSVITAVEESDGRDSSVVRRPIEIVSNPRHNQGRTVRRPLNSMGLKGKVAPPGIVQRSTDSAALIVSWIRHDLYRSSDHGGVRYIGLLHSCDNT